MFFTYSSDFIDSSLFFCSFQRVKKCLLDASNHSVEVRRNLIDCARGRYVSDDSLLARWKNSSNVNDCFQENGLAYGIYLKAVNLTTQSQFFTRFSYSLFWGFQVN